MVNKEGVMTEFEKEQYEMMRDISLGMNEAIAKEWPVTVLPDGTEVPTEEAIKWLYRMIAPRW